MSASLISRAHANSISSFLQSAESNLSTIVSNTHLLEPMGIDEWVQDDNYKISLQVTGYFDINSLPYNHIHSRQRMQDIISQMHTNMEYQQSFGFGMGRCLLMTAEHVGKVSKSVCQLMLRFQLLEKATRFVRERFANCKTGEQTIFCRTEDFESSYDEILEFEERTLKPLKLEFDKNAVKA